MGVTWRHVIGPEFTCVVWWQEEIHELLLSFAEVGATVVRLKGGDPLVRSRCPGEGEGEGKGGSRLLGRLLGRFSYLAGSQQPSDLPALCRKKG